MPAPAPVPVALHSEQAVSVAANRAAEDILAALDLADEPPMRSAVDLVVNATLAYLANPSATLQTVAAESYSEPLSTILEWVRS